MTEGLGVHDRRWPGLVEGWERHPLVVPATLDEPPIPPSLFFHVLLAASDVVRDTGVADHLVLWLDGRKCEDLPSWLPTPHDESIEGWCDRTARRMEGAPFTLLCANPHLLHPEFFARARLVARQLISQVGLPCGGLDSSLFVGRYTRTPFGVHRGQMSVLTVPTVGPKHFRLWPRGYGESHPDLQDQLAYDDHLDPSLEIHGGPGDIMYWPADFWHIAESEAIPTAAWNLGIWWDHTPNMLVAEQIADALMGPAARRHVSYGVQASAVGSVDDRELPPELRDAVRSAQQYASSHELGSQLQGELLRRLSCDGFREVPEIEPRAELVLPDRGSARLASHERLLWQRDELDRLHVAINGFHVTLPDHPVLHELVAGLARGAAVGYDLGQAPAVARRLLELLLRIGAVGVVP